MTTTFQETANNDLALNVRNLTLLSGLAAVMQNCKSAIEAQRGEMLYAASNGMPTQAFVFDRYNPALFEAAARTILRGVKDVVAVEHFQSRVTNGILNYRAVIRTIYGSGVAANPVGAFSLAGDILDYNFILDQSNLGAGP